MTTELEDISVDFTWNGKPCTAFCNAIIESSRRDVGPEGYREHVYCQVAGRIEIEKLEILLDGNTVENPDDDLKYMAEDLLMQHAEEKFDSQ